MKTITKAAPLLIGACLISQGSAATLTTLTAAGSAPSSEGWSVTTTSGDPSQNGEFSGDSGSNGDGNGAGAGNPAWALYANSGQTAAATYTTAGGALDIGQALGIDFDNGFIDNGSVVGVVFESSGTEALAVTFTGGQASYAYTDSSGSTLSGVSFTDDGLNISVELTASGSYSLDIGGTNVTGTLNNSLTSIDSVRVFNNSAGSFDQPNVFFNNVSVVPEPSSALLGGLSLLGLLRRRR